MHDRIFTAPEELERIQGWAFELRLGANESAFGPSPKAVEAAGRELRRAWWYADPDNHDLVEELAQRPGLSRAHIAVGNGIDDLLRFATSRLIQVGDVAVATAGTYPVFADYVRANGGRCVTTPYRSDFSVDLLALAKLAVRHDARIVYVANPDNPTGSYVPEQDLSELSRLLPARCALLVDEAYHEFAAPGGNGTGEPQPADSSEHPLIARFRTFSKGYGLAGLRIGYAVFGSGWLPTLLEARQQLSVNRIAQAAALAALRDAAHLRSVVEEARRGRLEYMDLGRTLGWQPLPSQANFVTFRLESAQLASAWVETLARHGVFVRQGFGSSLNDCVRVTVGTRHDRSRFADIVCGIHDARSPVPTGS